MDGPVMIDRPLMAGIRLAAGAGADAARLCSLCAALGRWYASSSRERVRDGDPELAHHGSWEALGAAAAAGCPLCLRLARVAEERICGGTIRAKLDAGKSTAVALRATADGRLDVSIGMPWASFEAYVLEDDPAARWDVPLRSRNEHGANGYLDLTSSIGLPWLRHCRSSHRLCNEAVTTDFVPTRLVDIMPAGEPESLRLVETSDVLKESGLSAADLEYVAFSHCWGATPHYMTKEKNVEDRQQLIPWSALNQTFQDAIRVTHQFGIRYIWIDALCIIQGDTEDWERESSMMGLIYGNCRLNICADAAEDGDQGFLPSREPIALPYQTGGDAGTIWLKQLPVRRFVSYSGDLRRRGWVLQEYVLSPRTIRYGTYGLLWECREDWQSADELISEEIPGRREIRELKLYPKKISTGDMAEILPVWYKIVQEYTRKELTDKNDNLPAISGLASLIHRSTGERYLAGVWECDVLSGLAWTTESPVWRMRDSKLAPSWSWAAVRKECPVIYFKITAPFRARVVESKVVTEGSNPLGRVTDGHLKVEGWLAMATVSEVDTTVLIGLGPNNKLLKRCPRNFFATGPLPQVAFLLLAGDMPQRQPDGEYQDEEFLPHRRLLKQSILILELADGDAGRYRRIDVVNNTARFFSSDWFGMENQIITLI